MHCIRLDIAHAVCKLSRFTSNPSTMHWKGIGRVLGYLKRTIRINLSYTDFLVVLECYSDASWINVAGDSVATSG